MPDPKLYGNKIQDKNEESILQSIAELNDVPIENIKVEYTEYCAFLHKIKGEKESLCELVIDREISLLTFWRTLEFETQE